jgi:hypothetical protein
MFLMQNAHNSSAYLPVGDLSSSEIEMEWKFWEINLFRICILGDVPETIPPIAQLNQVLAEFRLEKDYFNIVKRANVVRQRYLSINDTGQEGAFKSN